MKKNPWWLLCFIAVMVLSNFLWSQPQEYIGIGNTGKAVIGKDSLGELIFIPKAWSVHLMVYNEKGDSVRLRIGVDSLASNGFDKDLDVPIILPPPLESFYAFLYLDDKDYPDIYTLSEDYQYFSKDKDNKIVWLGGFGGNNSDGKKIIKWSTSGLEFINIGQKRELTISTLGGEIVVPVDMGEIDSFVIPKNCGLVVGFLIQYKTGNFELVFAQYGLVPPALPSTHQPIIPKSFALFQNYPNPFNGSTTIEFAIPENGNVTFAIYNVLGEKVRTLVDGNENAGMKRVIWDTKDNDGKLVTSGIYFYRIETQNKTLIRQMFLMK